MCPPGNAATCNLQRHPEMTRSLNSDMIYRDRNEYKYSCVEQNYSKSEYFGLQKLTDLLVSPEFYTAEPAEKQRARRPRIQEI